MLLDFSIFVQRDEGPNRGATPTTKCIGLSVGLCGNTTRKRPWRRAKVE